MEKIGALMTRYKEGEIDLTEKITKLMRKLPENIVMLDGKSYIILKRYKND